MLSFLSALSIKQYIVITCIVLILLLMILKKFFKKFYDKFLLKCENFIKPIADEAVRHSAKYLNSQSGQAKMEEAVRFVQDKSKTAPWFIKIFLSKVDKKFLVDIIEKSYQAYKLVMNSEIEDKELDVKGNEVKKN